MSRVAYTLGDLAERLGADLRGDGSLQVSGLATLQDAGPEHLSFRANAQYRKFLAATKAGGVLLTAKDADGYTGAALVVANPYLAYARLSHLFERRPLAPIGIHSTAVVDPSASVDPSARIGAQVVIEADAWVGPGVEIGAQSLVGARSRIGAGGRLAARVTLCHDVIIGERVVIQPGAVIGGEGFGFANEQGSWEKIAQLGGVRIGDDVEIGANTTIDRGAISDTVIGNGVKLDNQIQLYQPH